MTFMHELAHDSPHRVSSLASSAWRGLAVVLVVLFTASCGGGAFLGSCDRRGSDLDYCEEQTRTTSELLSGLSPGRFRETCESQGDTYSEDACPMEGRVGGCALPFIMTVEVEHWYYPPNTAEHARTVCSGTFLPAE